MKVVFRADASIRMGTGHVMRCLTLADALTAAGVECHFISREHEGHLIDHVVAKGHRVHRLAILSPVAAGLDGLAHAEWLGGTQADDVAVCRPLLESLKPDWLVVDHYALDIGWEHALRPQCARIMVIDDLADRGHDCDLLLDQTYGREVDDYALLIPSHARCLCGSRYALLRPEFAAWRPYSLARRQAPELRHVLVSLGGTDPDNITSAVLGVLGRMPLPRDCAITVVLGATAPWADAVRTTARSMPWPTTVRQGVTDMAQLMANSDLAIGAAGSSAWERCCLGLPSAMLVLADNQRKIAEFLVRAGAAVRISLECGDRDVLRTDGSSAVSFQADHLAAISQNASAVADGLGALRTVEAMMAIK